MNAPEPLEISELPIKCQKIFRHIFHTSKEGNKVQSDHTLVTVVCHNLINEHVSCYMSAKI